MPKEKSDLEHKLAEYPAWRRGTLPVEAFLAGAGRILGAPQQALFSVLSGKERPSVFGSDPRITGADLLGYEPGADASNLEMAGAALGGAAVDVFNDPLLGLGAVGKGANQLAKALGIGEKLEASGAKAAAKHFLRPLDAVTGETGAIRGRPDPEILKKYGLRGDEALRMQRAMDKLRKELRPAPKEPPPKLEPGVEAAEDFAPPPVKAPSSSTQDMTPGKVGKLEASTRPQGIPGIGDTVQYISPGGQVRNMHVTDYNPERGVYSGVDMRSGGQVLTDVEHVTGAQIGGRTHVFDKGQLERAREAAKAPKVARYDEATGQMVVEEGVRPAPSKPTRSEDVSLAQTLGAPTLKDVRKAGPVGPAIKPGAEARSAGFMGTPSQPRTAAPRQPAIQANERVMFGNNQQGVVRGFKGDTAFVQISKDRVLEIPRDKLRRQTPEEYWGRSARTITSEDVAREQAKIDAERAAREAKESQPKAPRVMSKKQQIEESRASVEAMEAAAKATKQAANSGDIAKWTDADGRLRDVRVGAWDDKENVFEVRDMQTKETFKVPTGQLEVVPKVKVEASAGVPGDVPTGGIFGNERGAVRFGVGDSVRVRDRSGTKVPGKVAALLPDGGYEISYIGEGGVPTFRKVGREDVFPTLDQLHKYYKDRSAKQREGKSFAPGAVEDFRRGVEEAKEKFKKVMDEPWQKYLKDEGGFVRPGLAAALGLGTAGALGIRKVFRDAEASKKRRQEQLDRAARSN